MFDIRHKNASYSIQELFQDVSEIHSYDARSFTLRNFYKKKKKKLQNINSTTFFLQKFGDALKIEKSP